jgi:ABC-type lipoprotein export system ATPase subunit
MSWWRREHRAPEQVDADGPVVRLGGVSRMFKGDADEETWALREVTLEIGRGEYVCMSGPSGCGKSTLLSVLGLSTHRMLAVTG